MSALLTSRSRVLVPLRLPDPEEVPQRMIELLGSTRVLLVGWLEVPEQTPPEQAKEELDETGEDALESVAERLREAGADVEVRHLFTPDLVATIQRVGAEEACDAALISRPLARLDRMLVVLREGVDAHEVGTLLSDLSEDEGPDRVTLLQISEDAADEGRDWSERVLERLQEREVETDRVETRVETADEPPRRVLEICQEGDFDLVIIPERGELEDQLFGSFAEEVGREARLPVLVIRGGDGATG